MATLLVRVIPNARRDEIIGAQSAGAIKIKLQAPALEGKANEALRRLLSQRLGVPAADILFKAGLKARDKRLEIVGLDEAELRGRLGLDEGSAPG